MDFFLVLLASAEFDARAAFRFRANQAGTLQIVGAMLDVRAKFVVHIRVHPGRLKKSGDAKSKRIEMSHTSSNG